MDRIGVLVFWYLVVGGVLVAVVLVVCGGCTLLIYLHGPHTYFLVTNMQALGELLEKKQP